MAAGAFAGIAVRPPTPAALPRVHSPLDNLAADNATLGTHGHVSSRRDKGMSSLRTPE